MSWYHDFFTESYLKGRSDYLTLERTRAEVVFLSKYLSLVKDAKVLDLCCGQGRHSVEIAKLGCDVTGVDLSEFLLSEARLLAQKEGVEVEFIRSDMREIQFAAEFDACINMFTAFAFLESDEEDAKVIQNVGKALKPGGRFLIDFINRDNVIRNLRPHDWKYLEDGSIFFSERFFDCFEGKMRVKEINVDDSGEKVETYHEVRFYTPPEMRKMIEAAGMKVIASFGGFDESPLSIDSRRMILLSQKL
ncbi:MAG: class I SAM-dependent methyltransferase [Planctomycetes bacterium]|nr:class I SAM-dependent methyltransferase [Planctomycetota bacterium]